MAAAPVRFHSRDGRIMFAFDGGTDPESVVFEYAWAWAEPDRQQVCDLPGCPTTEGRYCLDCHAAAHNAVATHRKRWPDPEATP